MELEEFVARSLTQIVEGVVSAQRNVDRLGAEINPRFQHISGDYDYVDAKRQRVAVKVEFDLAVTATKMRHAADVPDTRVGEIQVVTHERSQEADSFENRIRFRVPIFLPEHEITLGMVSPTGLNDGRSPE